MKKDSIVKIDDHIILIDARHLIKDKSCLECGEKLTHKWFSHEEQEKIKKALTKKYNKEFRDEEFWGGTCSKCSTINVKINFGEESWKLMPFSKETKNYDEEKKLADKIAFFMMPKAHIKIMFAKSYGPNSMSTDFHLYKSPQSLTDESIIIIILPIEFIVDREKSNPGFFCETMARALAENSVDSKSQTTKSEYKCLCKERYSNSSKICPLNCWNNDRSDKKWHDKLDEFREKIKENKLTEGSGYSALGKEFVLEIDENQVCDENGKRLKICKASTSKEVEKLTTDKTQESNSWSKKNSENRLIWTAIIFLFFVLPILLVNHFTRDK